MIGTKTSPQTVILGETSNLECEVWIALFLDCTCAIIKQCNTDFFATWLNAKHTIALVPQCSLQIRFIQLSAC